MKQLKVSEYANELGISVPTVYRHIKAGKLQTETVDGILYVLSEPVDNSNRLENESEKGDNENESDNQNDNDNESENDVITQIQACLNLQQAEIEQLQQELLQVQTRVDWLSKQLATGWTGELRKTELIMLQRTDFRSNDKSSSSPDD